MKGWIENVKRLITSDDDKPRAAASLRVAAGTPGLDFEEQRLLLFEAQQLAPILADVLQGPMKLPEYKDEQLRERMEFDLSHAALLSVGSMEDYERDRARERAGITEHGPLSRRVCVGYNAPTLDTTEFDEDEDY
jgi:hypothetical protein